MPFLNRTDKKETKMPRKKAAKFTCQECGKAFDLAMHLGRHMTTIHGQTPKAAKVAKSKKARKTAKVGARKHRRGGPTAGVVGQLGLHNLSIDQLVEVIAAAKQEGQRRIAEMQQMFLAPPPKRVGRPQGQKAVATPKAPAKPKAPASPKAPTQAKRRGRRKFKVTGTESILAFVKGAGKQGVTTAEIVKNWKKEGRSGDGYTTLGELVKVKKLKKEKIQGAKGSRYTAA